MLLDEALPPSRPTPRLTSTPGRPEPSPLETSAPVAKAPKKPRRLPPISATAAAVVSVVVVIGLLLLPSQSPYGSTEARALSDLFEQQVKARTATADVQGAVVSIARTVSPGGEARVLVLKDSVPELFALPDHTLVVTTGLLARLETDAQLAALIAHVRGHEALGHIEGIDIREGPGVPDALRTAATAVMSANDERRADDHALDALTAGGWKLQALGRAEALLRADAKGWSEHHVRDIAVSTASEGQERPAWYAQFVLAHLKAKVSSPALTSPPAPPAKAAAPAVSP